MKKFSSLLLALALLFTTLLVPAMAEEQTIRLGELTWLNSDDAARMAYMENLVQYLTTEKDPEEEEKVTHYAVTEYDTLNSMLMGLTSGQIDEMMIYFTVGAYLCANNDAIELELTSPDYSPDASLMLISALTDIYKGTDFSFLMTESNEALRDAFNEAIQSMEEDGKLYDLIAEQITTAVAGEEIEPVIIDKIDGAETIKVAVTGDLPPMDYIAADGTPAGFNTAVLAEISRRIGKNIELVSIDSGARATALASGSVDVVFWARVNTPRESFSSSLTEQELSFLNSVKVMFDQYRNTAGDIPEGTIYTVPYYHDIFVNVVRK